MFKTQNKILTMLAFLATLTFLLLIIVLFEKNTIFEICKQMYHSDQTRKLPSAIIIGAKKCGTGTLIEFIGMHPNVSASDREILFFNLHYRKGYEW